jgi:galactokinase
MTLLGTLRAIVAARNGAPSRAWFVPGRIEVLGKHTDYAGGRSLLCAIDRGFSIVAAPRVDRLVSLEDPEQGLLETIALDPALPPAPGHWSDYPRVVARRLARHFPSAQHGADIGFISDLPVAAGISSSSAFVVASWLALAAGNDIEADQEFRAHIRTKEDLAGFLAAVENGYTFGPFDGDTGVGILGGSEDHTAILCCEPHRLAVYSFNPVRHERTIDLDPALHFVVGACGIVAAKAGSARDSYNRASVATRRILELWNAETGRTDRSLAAAATSGSDAPDRIRGITRERGGDTREYLLGRFDQFFAESEEIVPAASERLAAADYEGFGALVDRSQELAERLLGNQVPQTIHLARSARRLGALAASAFGGGFGGSVWALVRADGAHSFIERWSSAYRQAYPDLATRALFFATAPGGAAREIA